MPVVVEAGVPGLGRLRRFVGATTPAEAAADAAGRRVSYDADMAVNTFHVHSDGARYPVPAQADALPADREIHGLWPVAGGAPDVAAVAHAVFPARVSDLPAAAAAGAAVHVAPLSRLLLLLVCVVAPRW